MQYGDLCRLYEHNMVFKTNGDVMNRCLCKILTSAEISIKEALQSFCESGKGVLFLVENNRLQASLSDGDVRRFLLKGGSLDSSAKNAANFSPKFLYTTEREYAQSFLTENRIAAVPIVDDELNVIDIVSRYENVNMDDVMIRELCADDLPLLLEFFDQMAGDTRAMFNRNDVNRLRVIEHFNKGVDDDQVYFGAIVKSPDDVEKLVGYVFAWDINTCLPWLGIAVREDWKGHHLGRRLLTYLDQWALHNKMGGLMLTSVPANIRAHSLYERMGFQYYGVHPSGEFLYIKRYLAKDELK